MLRLLTGLSLFAALAASSAAQDNSGMHSVVPQAFGVMENVVKGAPYSAEEITTFVQTLGDGTHISRKSQVTVHRDSEGRVRRESPTDITIWDPVAEVKISLVPKTMTAIQTPISKVLTKVTTNDATGAQLQKLKAELDARTAMKVNGSAADAQTEAAMKAKLDLAMASMSKSAARAPGTVENLGPRSIEGVNAEGTRTTYVVETGAIGNDRPIRTIVERWYSPDLQMTVQQTTDDPRTGEETLRMVNVRRGEPDYSLFTVPPGYQLISTPAAAKKYE